MGLLRFVKAASAKIFGATETAAAPPERCGARRRKVPSRCGASRGQARGQSRPLGQHRREGRSRENHAGDRRSGRCCHGPRQYRGGRRSRRIEVFYTVQSSDTLGKIAGAEYGPGHAGEYHRILEANKPLLSDADKIYPAKRCGFFRFRAEGLRMKRREDIFESCALAG
jgi:nucleoid-associated protein YgaU